MKIGIVGTRGIPNRYGGFEQFAQSLSCFLVKQKHQVYVYNSSNHPYKDDNFEGVHIIHAKDPEKEVGTIGQFIYDLNCILDARKRDYDIILQLGYTSSSIWSFLFPRNSVIITNMDGLEWKRAKYSFVAKKFLKFAEKLAANQSDFLISDSIPIKRYLQQKYLKESKYIAYGGAIFNKPNEEILKKYEVKKFDYNMLIARIEPENSIHTILEGVSKSSCEKIVLVIGNYDSNNYGKQLKLRYRDHKQIKFLGGIYDMNELNNLRFFSNIYFHGHSVGGTNPSLLEAMASKTLIVAHDNEFNRYVLEEDAFYFQESNDIHRYCDTLNRSEEKDKVENNLNKISSYYNYKNINELYLSFFNECIQ